MKEEKWIKWEPLENIPWKVSVDSVEKIKDSLVMNFHEFKKPESQLRIVFNTGVRFYAKSIETCRLTTIASIYEKYGNDLYKWSFFKVLDSAHLDWLKRESNLKSKVIINNQGSERLAVVNKVQHFLTP